MEALLEVMILLENICMPIEGNKNDIIYHFCGMMIKSGRITQFKFHLSHTDPHSNSKKCPNEPPDVKK